MTLAARGAPRPMRERLLRFLNRELAAGRDDMDELHSLPIEERVERGYCIDRLRFLSWENNGARLVLECRENSSRFRAGESLTLGYGHDPGSGVGVHYVAFDPAAGRLRVDRDPWRREGWESLDLARPLALDQVRADHIRIAIEAIENVYGARDERSARIQSILEGTMEPAPDPAGEAAAARLLEGLPLDASQREAFVRCFAQRPLHLVQGPPGSGKTWLIASLVAAWARGGERILVTAQTHRAVNNVLARVVELDPGSAPVVKAGDFHNAEDLPPAVGRAPSFAKLGPAPRAGGQVVGATVFALRRAWGEAPFDRVVFDEAAQILVPLAVCGMLAGRRYVFVGDHRQLGPIVSGDHGDELAGLSIFEHLAGRCAPTLLRHTYRMNDGINAFPSRAFYGDELASDAAAAARRFPLVPGGPLDALLDPGRPAVIAALAHEGSRTRSIPEALLVTDLVEDLLVRQRIDPREVAVLTPYRAQIRAIRTLVERRLAREGGQAGLEAPAARTRGAGKTLSSAAPAPPRASARWPLAAAPASPDVRRPAPQSLLLIDTVERMQGQEREVVIVSLACSEPEYAAREAAFFFSPNRLNVMLTRARTKLVIVASPHLFGALPADLEQLRHASLFARLWRELPKVDLSDRYISPDRAKADR